MKNQQTESLQNRFSAYLVVVVTSKRISYMERKRKQTIMEHILSDIELKGYLDFEDQYHNFLGEQTAFVMEDWERYQEFVVLLESDKLIKILSKLNERERRLLFARVFGELTFEELGKWFYMKPKQAEMAFYYVLRKIRKEMKGNRKDEF